MKRILLLLLTVHFILALASCGGAETNDSPADSVSSSLPVPDGTGTDEIGVRPVGADSVKTLIEKSLEFLRSGGDYSKIKDVHDPKAFIAYFLIEDICRDRDLSFADAMEKASLFYGSSDDLKKEDPALYDEIIDEFDVMEPAEAVNEYMTYVRDAVKSGEIETGDPNYGKYAQMLTDWDKGADYMLEHYPEISENAEKHYSPIGIDGALKMIRKFAEFGYNRNNYSRYSELQTEYKPENTNVGINGICSYELGQVIQGNDVWIIDMNYYVENERYYLICFSEVLGSLGG